MLQVNFLPTLPSLLTQANTPLIHRDLSWLQFNQRVLSEARQQGNPLLERVKFLAISSSNIDEFFMIRLASLGRSIGAAARTDRAVSDRLAKIRASILETVAEFSSEQSEALDLLAAELFKVGIFVVRNPAPEELAFELGKKIFEEQVLPRLSAPEPFTAQAVGSLENLQLGVVFNSNLFFRIPRAIPSVLFSRTENGEGAYFFFLDDLLKSHLGTAFRLNDECGFLRLTRDGDFTADLEEEDTESIPDIVRSGLGIRDKGRAVRLQYHGELSARVLQSSAAALKLIPAQLILVPQTMCLHGLWTVVNQAPAVAADAQSVLRYPPLPSHVPSRLRNPATIFDEIKKKDVLLHHPYDSFDSYVAWIQAACDDPDVVSIEQTVYRMDTLSPVIEALKAAAHRKKVKVIIELRARFDELNNLALADQLRKAGVEVAFGFGQLKLHAKIALVTRKEGSGETLYAHLSTGNYNAFTARQYTDLAVLTANPEIGADARVFFDAVWKGEVPASFKQIVTAPAKLHRRLITHIQAETQAAEQGRKARIVAKVNALVDGAVIEHLYRASQAGVQVDLIVRGACSLIPGVQELSENIRVVSVVDRFLEHSRLYYFGDSKVMYLSSADWMPRNFFSRLEIAFPVLDPHLYQYLEQVVIPAYLSDTVKARELTPQGTWKKRSASFRGGKAGKPVRSQFLFQELAEREYKGTSLE